MQETSLLQRLRPSSAVTLISRKTQGKRRDVVGLEIRIEVGSQTEDQHRKQHEQKPELPQ